MKQKENGIVKRRSSRSSAQEATKKLKSDFAVPSGDDGQGLADITKSKENEKKGKALRKRQVPLVVAFKPPEESSSDKNEETIRYFGLGFLFNHFVSYLFVFVFFKSKKTNPGSQGDLPHVVRQGFRQSVSWYPGPREKAAPLLAEKNRRKSALRMQHLHRDVQPTGQPQTSSACPHRRSAV